MFSETSNVRDLGIHTTCLQKVQESKWTDAALIISSAALLVIGILASIGVFNFIGTANAAYLSYGMYGGTALFFIIEIIRRAIYPCPEIHKNLEFQAPVQFPLEPRESESSIHSRRTIQSTDHTPLNVAQTTPSQSTLPDPLLGPPIIKLDYSHGDYKKTGIYYGQQVAPQICSLIEQFHSHLTPQMMQLAKRLHANIPKDFQDEIKGVVEGFNGWAASHNKKAITSSLLLALHLIPDAFALGNGVLGCTIVIGKDPTTHEIIVGRTADWTSNQQAVANHTLIIIRNYGTFETVEFGIPGFVGTLSGIRQDGFSVFTNVCASDGDALDIKGMPAVFLNRLCLMREQVNSMKTFLAQHRPIGQYHLTVADKTAAATYYLRTKRHSHKDDWERTLTDNNLLIVTNCHYDASGYSGIDVFRSFHRHRAVQAASTRQRPNDPLKIFINKIFSDEASFLSNNGTLQFIRFKTNKPDSIHCSFADQDTSYGFAPSQADLLKLHRNTADREWKFSRCRKN